MRTQDTICRLRRLGSAFGIFRLPFPIPRFGVRHAKFAIRLSPLSLSLGCLLAGIGAGESLPDSIVRREPSRKSPGTAALLSALVPGGGQVYTGKWWKACIIAPAELSLAYVSVQSHRAAAEALKEGREDRYIQLRERRNTFLYFTGAVLAFSMADAYVSARMYGFDRQMEFTLGPGRAGVTAGMRVLE